MKKFKAVITVGLKPEVNDIKAITLKDAVSNFIDVKDFECKTFNTYAIEFCAKNKIEAEKTARKIAENILSNGVIEEYNIQWENPYVRD